MKYIIVALGLAVLNININAQDTLPNYNADTKALADILVNIIKEQNVGGGEYLYINARDGNITYKFLNRIVLNIE